MEELALSTEVTHTAIALDPVTESTSENTIWTCTSLRSCEFGCRDGTSLELTPATYSIVGIASFIGVFLPLLCAGLMGKALFRNIFFAAKHFGTGIILSTAFVHLLYHAFIMFGNTCLGELAFEPAAAAISLGRLRARRRSDLTS